MAGKKKKRRMGRSMNRCGCKVGGNKKRRRRRNADFFFCSFGKKMALAVFALYAAFLRSLWVTSESSRLARFHARFHPI